MRSLNANASRAAAACWAAVGGCEGDPDPLPDDCLSVWPVCGGASVVAAAADAAAPVAGGGGVRSRVAAHAVLGAEKAEGRTPGAIGADASFVDIATCA